MHVRMCTCKWLFFLFLFSCQLHNLVRIQRWELLDMTSWAICSILEIRAQVFLKIWQPRKHLQTPGRLCWFLPIKHSEMLANYLQIASFLINEQIHLWSRLFLPGLLNFSLTLAPSLSRFHFCKWNCPGTEKRFKISPSVIMPLTTKYHPAKRPCNFLKRKEASRKVLSVKVWKMLSATLVIPPVLRSDRSTVLLTPNPSGLSRNLSYWRQNSSEYLPPWQLDVALRKRQRDHTAFAEKWDKFDVWLHYIWCLHLATTPS